MNVDEVSLFNNRASNPARWRARLFYWVTELRIAAQARTVASAFDRLLDIRCARPTSLLERVLLPNEIQRIIEVVHSIRGNMNPGTLPTNPTVSVVIPHFEQYRYLEDALVGLQQQSRVPDEVVVVDDCSTDPTSVQAICRSFDASLNILLFISREKLYPGGARQLGAQLAHCDLLFMHDADDISHPDRILLTVNEFVSKPNTFQVNCGFFCFHSHPRFIKMSPNDAASGSNISGPDAILADVRSMFISQHLSVPRWDGLRMGGYGRKYPFAVSAGHVAYPRFLSDLIKWRQPDEYVFTPYEDFDFNLVLFLAFANSLQIDLPLIAYRSGSSSNIVFW